MRPETWWRRLSPHTLDIAALKRIVVVGVAVRLALWLASRGSNDIRAWRNFAHEIEKTGLLNEYVVAPAFNHPPLMGLWSLVALELAHVTHAPFAQVFKLFPLTCDMLALWALFTFVRSRTGDDRAAWRAAAIFSTSLASIWITAHHGNTDSACAFLLFVAVALVDKKDRPFLAGLALAAALNVKLIPLVILPALFVSQATSLRQAARFCAGLGLGLLPFLFPALAVGRAFYQNAIAYNSQQDSWGIHYFLHVAELVPSAVLSDAFARVDDVWRALARYVIMAASLALGVWGRRRSRRPVEPAALAIALFLVLAPGVGVQYFVFPQLLLIAADEKRGFFYSLAGGAFVSAVYLSYVVPGLPLVTKHTPPIGTGPALLGVLAWLVLVELVVAHLREAKSPRVA